MLIVLADQIYKLNNYLRKLFLKGRPILEELLMVVVYIYSSSIFSILTILNSGRNLFVYRQHCHFLTDFDDYGVKFKGFFNIFRKELVFPLVGHQGSTSTHIIHREVKYFTFYHAFHLNLLNGNGQLLL